MLLAADPDTPDFLTSAPQLCQAGFNGEIHRAGPVPGVLLQMSRRQAAQAFIFFRSLRHDGPGFKIQHHGFGALSTAVDSNK